MTTKSKLTDSFQWEVSIRLEIILFVVLIGLALFARMYQLSADPPNRITFSQGIETDPPQYTIFARDAELNGNWNSFEDNRYITYQYSLVSLTSRAVFSIVGVGTYQANLVGVILSLFSLLFFYLIIRKQAGNGTALIGLFFVSINYIGIFWGRRPFLENGMILLFLAGLMALVYAEKKVWGHWLFGFFLAGSILFGKIIALTFIAVPFGYYLYKIFYIKDNRGIRDGLMMMVGSITLVLIWYLSVYRPNSIAVVGYVGEQALGLYGLPEGLTSFSKFIWKMVSFGKESEFFDRMPIISIGAVASLILIASRFLYIRESDESGHRRFPEKNSLLVISTFWLIGTFLGQMIWNYQPIRYQTVLIFPLALLTALFLAWLRNIPDKLNLSNRSLIFSIVMLVVLMIAIYQITGAIMISFEHQFSYKENIWPVFLGALFLTVSFYIISLRHRSYILNCRTLIGQRWLKPVLILSALGISLVVHGLNYLNWSETVLFTGTDASRDLGQILTPGAVISGPFGPVLAMDNELDCVIHIFGTSRPDTLLFKKYPITHLAMEKSNFDAAEAIYPEIMSEAKEVCYFYLNCRKITIYRVAYLTGNLRASEYLMSNFEKAVRHYQLKQEAEGTLYLDRFLRLNPDNMLGNMQKGFDAYHNKKDYKQAVDYFKRAVEYSPTDFYVRYFLSKTYIAYGDSVDSDSLWRLGRRENELAEKYNLGYLDFGDFDDHVYNDSDEEVIDESALDQEPAPSIDNSPGL